MTGAQLTAEQRIFYCDDIPWYQEHVCGDMWNVKFMFHPPDSMDDLKTRITQTFNDLKSDRAMVRRAVRDMTRHVNLCVERDGGHVEGNFRWTDFESTGYYGCVISPFLCNYYDILLFLLLRSLSFMTQNYLFEHELFILYIYWWKLVSPVENDKTLLGHTPCNHFLHLICIFSISLIFPLSPLFLHSNWGYIFLKKCLISINSHKILYFHENRIV